MNTDTLAVLGLGAGVGSGIWLALSVPVTHESARLGRLRRWWAEHRPPSPGRRITLAVVVGLVACAWTGWPVAAPLGAAGAWVLPGLWGRDTAYEEALARIEAIAAWTEQLRDTMSAAAGLEQALLATAGTAPVAIRTEVATCAQRVRCNLPLTEALRSLAAELADPLGDLVVIALIGASGRTSGRLADVLSSLALSAREQAQMRARTAASRARVQTSVRIVVTTAVGMAVGLAVLDPEYVRPFASVQGQFVLLVIGAMFAVMFTWLRSIAAIPQAARLLDATAPETMKTETMKTGVPA
ncbi:tight adherence protein B [Streptacidiphilus sp. MAP12-16]|uniref:type II secretion system F family protein n=1 Tax=Streptacidiphilus sp. MAP12-16 TaxID=3156300 RepID=UPI0035143C44